VSFGFIDLAANQQREGRETTGPLSSEKYDANDKRKENTNNNTPLKKS